MQTGLDSAYPPTANQAAQAKAAGYSAWLGYFAGPNILNGWTRANFDTVKAAGLFTAAYCSGFADAAAMAAQSAAWGVPIILDDEAGIRSMPLSQNRALAQSMMHGGGPRPLTQPRFLGLFGSPMISTWVQPWLNTSGAGLYGNSPVFAGAHASSYVFAAYPGGDPGASWPGYYPRPGDGHPCGWQFQGTHSLFGIGVDATHFDDNFFGLHGGGGGQITGDDDMLYVGPFHILPATLKTFAPATVYADPSTSALSVGALANNASVAVKGFCYSTSGVQSSDRGLGAGPGIDLVWWMRTDGAWVPDADLITTGIAGAPDGAVLSTLPAGMKTYFATTFQSGPDDDSAFVTKTDLATAIAAIPSGPKGDPGKDAVTPTTGTIVGPVTVKLG